MEKRGRIMHHLLLLPLSAQLFINLVFLADDIVDSKWVYVAEGAITCAVCILALYEGLVRREYKLFLPYLIVDMIFIVFNLYPLTPIYYAAKWVKLARIMHREAPVFQHELLRNYLQDNETTKYAVLVCVKLATLALSVACWLLTYMVYRRSKRMTHTAPSAPITQKHSVVAGFDDKPSSLVQSLCQLKNSMYDGQRMKK